MNLDHLFFNILYVFICIFNITFVIYIRAEFNAIRQAILFNDSLLRQLNFGLKEFIIRMSNYVSKN